MTTERWANPGGGRRPREGNAAAWATAAEDKFMGYRANERGELSEDFVTAGDGLVALGATFILPVQTNYRTGRAAAGQSIYAKQSHPLAGQKTDKQPLQIQALMPNRPCSRARKSGAAAQPHARDNCPATAAAGERPCPPPPHRPRSGGRPLPTGALRRLLSPRPNLEQGPGLLKGRPFSLNKDCADQDA